VSRSRLGERDVLLLFDVSAAYVGGFVRRRFVFEFV